MKVRFNRVFRSGEFTRELKRLQKKYRSLEDDLQTFIDTQLYLFHKLGLNNGGLVPIDNLGFEQPQVYKARKFACKSLKGRGAKSGVRVIYTYLPENDEIFLIEIFFKGTKEVEDRERIKRLFSAGAREGEAGVCLP